MRYVSFSVKMCHAIYLSLVELRHFWPQRHGLNLSFWILPALGSTETSSGWAWKQRANLQRFWNATCTSIQNYHCLQNDMSLNPSSFSIPNALFELYLLIRFALRPICRWFDLKVLIKKRIYHVCIYHVCIYHNLSWKVFMTIYHLKSFMKNWGSIYQPATSP